VADTSGIYEVMDVFALSSLSEGLPNVLLEAMALEVPVVATRIAGILRLITDGENGLLIEPGSVEALAGALGRLLLDVGLRRKIAVSGRATIETRYSFARRMGAIRDLYAELLGRSPTLDQVSGVS
jgi:glycosyltransferase involved in cell wall biosynthesis